VRLGGFFFENPRKQPDAKVLKVMIAGTIITKKVFCYYASTCEEQLLKCYTVRKYPINFKCHLHH